MTKLELKQALETILFVATHPLSPKQLTELIGDCETKRFGNWSQSLICPTKKLTGFFGSILLPMVCRCTHFRNIKNGRKRLKRSKPSSSHLQ